MHRILSVSISGIATRLAQIADAVATSRYTGENCPSQLSTESAVITLIDAPAISPVGRSLRDRIDLPLRLLLALAAGIALTFLLDYIDASIGTRRSAALGLPILEIAPATWRTYLPWRRYLTPRLLADRYPGIMAYRVREDAVELRGIFASSPDVAGSSC